MHIPLSYSQESLWIIDKAMGSLNYHIPMVYKFTKAIDTKALEFTLKTILKRHQTLRTVFKQNEEGDVFQETLPIEEWKIFEGTEGLAQNDDEIKGYVNKLTEMPFDLEKDYMLRVHLCCNENNENFLILIFHHIAFDGWSSHLFLEELQKIYNLRIKGNLTNLPEVTYQYSDYSIHQRSKEIQLVFDKKIQFWEDFLEGHTTLNFPTDFKRPPVQSYKGKSYIFNLPVEYQKGLKNIGKQYKATPFMVLFGIYNILLHKYTGLKDIIIGIPTANRMHSQSQRLIGHFVNSLPFRTIFSDSIKFTELLNQIKENFIKVYEKQDVPFEKIVRAIGIEQDRSRSPLFQAMFIMQSNKIVKSVSLGDIPLTEIPVSTNTSKYDITCSITEREKVLEVLIEYCDELFSSNSIKRIAKHYENLIARIINNPEIRVNELVILSDEEQHELLNEFNDTNQEYPKEWSVLNEFENKCKEHPNQVSLVCEDKEMTYQELDHKSNQVANFLLERGVISNDIVGLCVNRSFDIIVGIFGIWKAGACYLPLDASYPEERINYILKDSDAKIIIHSDTITLHTELDTHKTIRVEDIFNANSDTKAIKNRISSEQLAYIIYTSGSTGKPKGVMISHNNLNNFMNWCIKEFEKDSFDIVYAGTSICFDLSIYEMIYPICAAKKIRILNDGLDTSKYIDKDKNILLNTVPSVIANLQENKIDFSNVNSINMAGEPIPEKVLNQIDYDTIIVRNLYGPSEDTTYSTFFRIHKGSKSLIGKPIANTKAYILDNDLNLVPKGIVGELCLGGKGVTAGYLKKAELTKQKFVQNPFEQNSQSKLYRTGDLAKWLPCGNLEFIGRKDSQVKLRGFRIELGEIESTLLEHEFVKQCAVIMATNDLNDKQLVAYIVSDYKNWIQEVEDYLLSKLPKYMTPTLWIELSEIPLNTNGKIDKKALPKPDYKVRKTSYIVPTNEVEEKLVRIWEKALNINEIGTHDTLTNLGGHSLIAAKLAVLINNSFSSNITISTILELQTIVMISKYIQSTIILENYEENKHEILDI